MRRTARYVQTGFLALEPRAFGKEFDALGGVAPKPFDEVGRIAVIKITGPLEQHPHWCWSDYETIHAQAEAAFASPCGFVALCINSPGGAAAGCFELSRALRRMSIESGKPLGVFVDGMACSAAYAIACSATAGISAPPTSTVASLAVYETIVDQTAADAAMGLKFLFVPSTGADLKLTGNAHVSPTGEQVQHTQAQVDLLTSYFYALVSEMRGVPEEQIRALRGASLLATQGFDNGLVDSVGDWDGFLAALETAKGSSTMGAQAKSKAPFEDALAALAEAAKDEDEEVAKKAKKMLAAHYAEDEQPNGDPKPEPAGSTAEGGDGDGDEEAKKAKAKAEADEEAKKAQALAAGGSNELSLAAQVHALQAKISQQEESSARGALMAQRPDFSAEVRKTLANAPIAVLENAVKTWPRVSATPQAAANAAQPGVTPGRADAATPRIRAEEKALLDRLGPRGPRATQARVEGTSLVLDAMTPEAAMARLEEMAKQGAIPQGVPLDMARVSTTEFKVQPR